MNRHHVPLLAFTTILGLMFAAPAHTCELIIEQAWVRDAPPTARVRVAYAIVRNPGSEPVTITGARSPAFGAIELHETREVDGVARMRRLSEVEVPAGGELHFEPGGKHFMLFRPTGELDGEHGSTLIVQACEREFDVPMIVRADAGLP